MSLAEAAIGLIAPAICIGCGSEGSSLCLACREASILPYGERCFGCGILSPTCRTCSNCRRHGAPTHVYVVTDYDGLAQELITRYKFGHQRSAAQDIAAMMIETLMLYTSEKDLSNKNYLLSFVPTATSRVRSRGFDHAKLLTRQVARNLQLNYADVLMRTGQSHQVGASRKTRFEQAMAAYYVKNNDNLTGRNILLIDDVVTTGATLAATAKLLRNAGASRVDALIFAKRL